MFSDFRFFLKRGVLCCLKPTPFKYFLYFSFLIIFSFFCFCYYDSLMRYIFPIFLLFLYELSFRFIYKRYHKKDLPQKFPLKNNNIPIEEHPYLPWVYKKNYNPDPNRKIYNNINADYMMGGMKTNNIRHVNGYDGGRDVEIPKPSDLFRIICLGDSTTCNYIHKKDGSLISWPLKLEEKLCDKFKNKKIEVNNCGVGAYNINEILIKFLIDTIDTQPNIVIFYHAFSNIRGYITPGFQRDFFHSRRTIASDYPRRVTLASYLPDFGLWCLRYLIGEYFSYLNIKQDLIKMINRSNTIDKFQKPIGLNVFKRNIETLIHVCKGKGIQLILSTYSYHLYDEIKNSDIHKKFYETVLEENKIITDLSLEHLIPLVKNQELIPMDTLHFIDEVHHSELGMDKLVDNFYSRIKDMMKSNTNDHLMENNP